VDEFRKNGYVHECIALSGIACQQFEYSLIEAEIDAITVSYLNNHLRVYVPSALAHRWWDSNDVGFDTTLDIDDKHKLYVLVEKDFKCLQERPHEDESDHFPNPNAKAC
jgi:hypothetical protein